MKNIDRISTIGLITIVIALFFLNVATFRPNRILMGDPLMAKALVGYTYYLLLVMVAAIAVMIGIKKENLYLNWVTSLLASGFAALMIYSVGNASMALITDEFPFGRVSLSMGFWFSLFGVYMINYGSSRYTVDNRLLRTVALLIVPLFAVWIVISGRLDGLSIMIEFYNRQDSFVSELTMHLILAFSAVGLGSVVGIGLGLLIYKEKVSEKLVFFFVNLAQTIPALSFLGIMMIVLTGLTERLEFLTKLGIKGIGWAPALFVLFAYTLLPITRNTLAGFRMVSLQILDAASGIGMNSWQIFWKVELPLALSVILSGIRTAMTQSIGNTIIAGLIGGGGLGTIIFLGLAQSAPDLILLGVLPVITLALITDMGMEWLVNVLTPEGLGGEK